MERCQFDRGQNRAAEYKCALKNMITLELLVWRGPLPLPCHIVKKQVFFTLMFFLHQMFLNQIQNHQAVTILWINSSSPNVSILFCLYFHLGEGGNVGNWGSWKFCKTDSIGLNLIGWGNNGCPRHLQSQR